ncbi:c-type cytochrome [Coralloluteibacterium stylophorae]|uniref:C-type cytochrome n=1 Tax=Coralloluteibacterium stylophorae TaxID=1776034 RepID=A0A8J7VWZ2_9GAMM|nr:c-type cytochrome [Coralloluteibacterium stylophorae]MBS7457230.1 c-type cytochrome [Coralloluteibacterium stylophorae]
MTLRITWKRALLTLFALAVFGMAVAWSGAINIAASSGHWPVTAWFLHWTMRNSARTWSTVQAPDEPLDDGGLVSAAGHFARSCAACHGAPGAAPSPVMQGATPEAPDLAATAAEWSDAELFWIVRHGVKYTGMPAWPAQDRDDEVRRMAAFVRRLPGMSTDEYRGLVGAGLVAATPLQVAGPMPVETCIGCHGADGRGRGQDDIPVLGGQHPAYLAATLRDYASGERESAIMANVAVALTRADIDRLASHFAALPGLPRAQPMRRADAPEELADAARIATEGLPENDLPACTSCHDGRKRDRYPVLSGQRAPYIAARLRAWRGEETVVDARKSSDTMPTIARRIPEDMIEPLARYWAAQSPEAGQDRR